MRGARANGFVWGLGLMMVGGCGPATSTETGQGTEDGSDESSAGDTGGGGSESGTATGDSGDSTHSGSGTGDMCPPEPCPGTHGEEAIENLQRIVDGAVEYFLRDEVPHLCPTPLGSPQGGWADPIFTPCASNCNTAPECKCVPSDAPDGPGAYDMTEWTGNLMWTALDFVQSEPHAWHYNFRTSNDTTGYGRCQFTAQAYADIDDDGVFSTYERVGILEESGASIGDVQITDECE